MYRPVLDPNLQLPVGNSYYNSAFQNIPDIRGLVTGGWGTSTQNNQHYSYPQYSNPVYYSPGQVGFTSHNSPAAPYNPAPYNAQQQIPQLQQEPGLRQPTPLTDSKGLQGPGNIPPPLPPRAPLSKKRVEIMASTFKNIDTSQPLSQDTFTQELCLGHHYCHRRHHHGGHRRRRLVLLNRILRVYR
ncbi:hypothetical protein H4R33_004824 [Dimargaris cristalligena]|nr:hypothetical protein H4R33_004824 [Dimargaris cristalligena]